MDFGTDVRPKVQNPSPFIYMGSSKIYFCCQNKLVYVQNKPHFSEQNRDVCCLIKRNWIVFTNF